PADVEKKLTAREIDTIRQWIEAGAKTLRDEPADADPSRYLTEEERNYWAFQPVRRPRVPAVDGLAGARSPIDHFIAGRLAAESLAWGQEASPATLARRLFFDLWGLPPAPEDIADFLADRRPDAYEHLVDRLLAAPQYGERWGRHWLDAAGYADSEGYQDEDAVRPDAWKYRDYVIEAWNADKPYDRFLVEQLAGDELVGRELKNLTPAEVECLTATGFLRMAPDGTAASGTDQDVARNEVMAKTIEIMSTSVMGLTVGCAQCHNHRYDPISQEDYYALRAVFEPALDWKKWLAPPQRRLSLYTDADRQAAQEVEHKAREVEAARAKKQSAYIQATFERELAKLPTELHAEIRAARDTVEKSRTPEQKRLLQQHPSVNVSAGSLYLYDRKAADELQRMADEASRIRQTKPQEQFVRALWEPVEQRPPATYFFARGMFDQPKQVVRPAPLHILTAGHEAAFPEDDPAVPTSGRRLALARWLADGRHPLTARVMVNRVWMHHFGRGLVDTPGDFGFLGGRPTHPELLDWLASELVDSGWSLKRLHRLMCTSRTYRQSSVRRPELDAVDPDNRLYGRMSVRRAEAEVLRDSLLAVSGRLNLKAGGPPVPVMADRVGQYVLGIENLNAGRPGEVIPMKGEDFRRSVYAQVRRSRPLSLLEPFDLPRMEPNCTRRSASTVATQSLLLMNNEFMLDAAGALADRLVVHASGDLLEQIRWAWRYAYGADPDAVELGAAAQFVLDQVEYLAAHPQPVVDAADKKAAAGRVSKPVAATAANPQRDAMVSLCHALLSSNRFLYVD
ncbi:MAG: DUF1549 and DUF1553 domain-containing protein, partial [Pirellulaceae bacterium]